MKLLNNYNKIFLSHSFVFEMSSLYFLYPVSIFLCDRAGLNNSLCIQLRLAMNSH